MTNYHDPIILNLTPGAWFELRQTEAGVSVDQWINSEGRGPIVLGEVEIPKDRTLIIRMKP